MVTAQKISLKIRRSETKITLNAYFHTFGNSENPYFQVCLHAPCKVRIVYRLLNFLSCLISWLSRCFSDRISVIYARNQDRSPAMSNIWDETPWLTTYINKGVQITPRNTRVLPLKRHWIVCNNLAPTSMSCDDCFCKFFTTRGTCIRTWKYLFFGIPKGMQRRIQGDFGFQ